MNKLVELVVSNSITVLLSFCAGNNWYILVLPERKLEKPAVRFVNVQTSFTVPMSLKLFLWPLGFPYYTVCLSLLGFHFLRVLKFGCEVLNLVHFHKS